MKISGDPEVRLGSVSTAETRDNKRGRGEGGGASPLRGFPDLQTLPAPAEHLEQLPDRESVLCLTSRGRRLDESPTLNL